MVVADRFGDLEVDADLRVEARRGVRREVRGDVEREAVGADGELARREERAAAAVVVGRAVGELLPKS